MRLAAIALIVLGLSSGCARRQREDEIADKADDQRDDIRGVLATQLRDLEQHNGDNYPHAEPIEVAPTAAGAVASP